MFIKINDLIAKYKIDDIKGIIHVGGHHGEEYEDYVNAGIEHIVFIEPCRPALEVLNAKMAGKHNVIVLGYAFGDKPGIAEMYVESANTGQSNSLLEPKLHLEQFPSIVFEEREMVPVHTMDQFVRLRLGQYNFLNMDVQGYELKVLKGGTQTIDHIDYVYTEINKEELYKECALIGQLDEFLKDFERVETFWCNGGIAGNWGDAFYIRKSKLKAECLNLPEFRHSRQ